MIKKMVFISLILSSGYCLAVVYTCKNHKGEVSFSDMPCQNGSDKLISIKKSPTFRQKPAESNVINSDSMRNKSNKPIKASYNNNPSGTLGMVKVARKFFAINAAYASYSPKTNRMFVYLMPTEMTASMEENLNNGQAVSFWNYKDKQGRAIPYVKVEFIFQKGKLPVLKNLKYHIFHMKNMGSAKYSSASMSYPYAPQLFDLYPEEAKRFKRMRFLNQGTNSKLKLNYEYKEKLASSPYYWKFDINIDVHIIN